MVDLSESDFRLEADRALESVERVLGPLCDEHDVEVELQNGVLQVVFETPAPAKFIVSPNAPVRQMWVSAMARGYKLSWSPSTRAFTLQDEPLDALMTRLVRQYLQS